MLVAERTTTASNPSMMSARSESPSSTTSKRSRRSARPASAIGSRIRTLGRSLSGGDIRRLPVRLERARDRDSALDVGSALGEEELDRGKRGRDVEDVVVADVPDPEETRGEVAVSA